METFIMCVLLAPPTLGTPTCWKVVTTTGCASEMHTEWAKDYAWVERSHAPNKLTFFITCAPWEQFSEWRRHALNTPDEESTK